MAKLLIVDDEVSYRDVLKVVFEEEGHSVRTASGGADALALVEADPADVIVSDVRMPDMDGIELLKRARKIRPEIGIVLMTAFGTIDTARNAFLLGADDFIQKPFKNDELKRIIERTVERQEILKENKALRRSQSQKGSLENIVGSSEVMENLFTMIRSVAAEDSTVLITGETGTGKEMVARAVHELSNRAGKPFVPVNCGGVAETLIDAELFGFEKGSFTGAAASRIGLFEAAAGGTIFLDEIGDMTPSMQVKVLRVLQERTIRPVGKQTETEIDLRFIAATNRDLSELVSKGDFREDLFYRLSVIPIDVPPLRERAGDIPLLVEHFRKALCERSGKEVSFSEGALQSMSSREWKGNVRELEHCVERAVALASDGSSVGPEDVALAVSGKTGSVPALPDEGIDFQTYMKEFERCVIEEALQRNGGNQTKAAEWLRIPVHSLRHLIGKHSLGSEKADEQGA
ncbi:MAG TPA: sigma-54 dependent transcriptional regulator [Aridibacter sp.]|nr:sigma-54 dependent transcriptional regulator [Aridibacter sp.]